MAAIFQLPDEILQAQDPLEALVTQHRESAKRDREPDGWW